MRLLPLLVLGYVAIALQVGLTPHLRLGGATINFGLIAAAFVALNAPRETALAGAFLIGALQDLVSSLPLGTFAFSYGLAALALAGTQRAVHPSHPLTHVAVTLAGGILVALLLLLLGWIRADARVGFGASLGAAFLTAAAAPVLLWLVERIKRVFGFAPSRLALAGRGLRHR